MRFSINSMIFAGMLFLLLLNIGVADGQEWSKEQQMVWKTVQDYWAVSATGDIDGFMAYFDDSYLGWNISQPLPSGKAETRKWLSYFWTKSKMTIYEIQPVGIKVFGQVAIVHYYYTMLLKNEEGKEKDNSGRWTDVLMKKGDKWVLIADHGGENDD